MSKAAPDGAIVLRVGNLLPTLNLWLMRRKICTNADLLVVVLVEKAYDIVGLG